MINTLKRAPLLATSLALVLFGVATPASSQSPTDAQRSAIRSQCRSDYQAHCASIPPGGAASLQCLQQNMSSLSPGCQSAVRAVEAPSEPKAEAKPEIRAGRQARHRDRRAGDGAHQTGRRDPYCAGSQSSDGGKSGGKSDGQEAKRQPDRGGPQRLPFRLPAKLRRSADRRCGGAAMPAKEQIETLGELRTGGQRGQRWGCDACRGRRSVCRSPRSSGRRRSARARIGLAPDAAARGIVRVEVGLRWRRPRAVRRRSARRRPHHTMPGNAGGFAFAGVQGCAGPVRRAMN